MIREDHQKKGYKQTDVGIIPEDWEVKELSKISDKIMVGIASAATHAYRDKGIVLFRNQNIKDGFLDDSDILYINEKYELIYKNKRLKGGDLLIARTGYPGAACVVPDKYEGMQTFTTLIARPSNEYVRSDYLCNYLNSEKGQAFFDANQIGGGQKNVNAGTLKTMPIPIPPLPEQQAIAEVLSDVDALITSLDQLITKKRNIKQGTMQLLLTGKKRLPNFSGDWETKNIGDEIDLITGYPFPSNQYSNDGIKLLRGSNIKRGVTDWSEDLIQYWKQITPELKKYVCKEGDIVIAMDGSLVGKSYARLTKKDLPALLLQRVARIRSEKIDLGYLKEFIGNDYFSKYCDSVKTVTAIPHISPSDIRNFKIPIPPTIEEQKAIAQILSEMDAEIEALETQRDKYKAVKQGMMQELLTGKTRLI